MKNEKEIVEFVHNNSGDPKYQTIELNGKVILPGYSKSELSWKNIQRTGVSFQEKAVCDLGCYHGYFAFKIEEFGASKVVGIDADTGAIKVCSLLVGERKSRCTFRQQIVDSDFSFRSGYDIILTLNMLHHVKRLKGQKAYDHAIHQIFKYCREAIFEVNDVELPPILFEAGQNNFDLISKIESHRKTQFGDRFILYFKRK